MHIDKFFEHHGLSENPFAAEEARHDLVFERLKDTTASHPDFPKILGRLDRPTTSVVFGEKGSGKTAIRLLIGMKVVQHNEADPDGRTLLVAYDDLNPFLDRILQNRRARMGKRRAAKTGAGIEELGRQEFELQWLDGRRPGAEDACDRVRRGDEWSDQAPQR